MRIKYVGAMIAIFALISLASVAYATFDWSGTSINSGYAVTTDWHGTEVPLGEEVTAWAGTTDDDIEYVVFRWLPPGDGTPINETGNYEGSQLWDGETVYEWTSKITPDMVGDWGVQAIFYNDDGHGTGPYPEAGQEKVAIRARSFFGVPEVPIGTMAAIIAMFGALSLFALKRKHL